MAVWYSKDFSFIAEDNLSHIFTILSAHRVKVNVMQNSAVSFSVCADHTEKIVPMLDELKETYNVLSNESLELLTIRHYTEEILDHYSRGKEIFLEQKSRQTTQLVMKSQKINTTTTPAYPE